MYVRFIFQPDLSSSELSICGHYHFSFSLKTSRFLVLNVFVVGLFHLPLPIFNRCDCAPALANSDKPALLLSHIAIGNLQVLHHFHLQLESVVSLDSEEIFYFAQPDNKGLFSLVHLGGTKK